MKTIYVKIQVQDDFKEPAKSIQGIVDSDGWGFPFADIEQITLPTGDGLVKCDNCGCYPNAIYQTDKGNLCLICVQVLNPSFT